MKTILKNCRLIPELSNGCGFGIADLLLEDGKIAQIAEAGRVADQSGAESVFDCCGKTLMPGLFDLHTHMNWSYHNGEIRLDDFKIFIKACQSARLFLDNGITTIRDMGSPRRVADAVRRAVQAGVCAGPRMFCGGLIISPVSRPGETDPYNFLRSISGPDQMIRAVREEIGGGCDYVKLYTPILPEEMQAALRIANQFHVPVAVHAHDLASIRLCIESGVSTIEHGSYIDGACIEKLRDGSCYLVPTLAVLSPEIATPGFTPESKRRTLQPLLEANGQNIGTAYRAGLCLGFGTDTPIEELDRNPGMEFRMRKEHCGMSNIDMLLQATRNSARIVGLAGVTGEIKEGLCADLILIDGNPDEDISAMYKRPEKVWIGGKLHQPL